MKKKTAQPAGAPATNHQPLPIANRPETSYHEKQERSLRDKAVLGVVGVLAITVIALSFKNTAALAETLNLNPWLVAALVEILFGTLLFIRGGQRALQKNVPFFLDVGYFASLAFVTGVNMWGLGQIHPIGYVVGAAITGAMWLMERTLVWLWTDSHKPHEKTAKELEKEAEEEIKKAKILQRIDWKKWEAQKPDLALIKEAREAEKKREKVVKDGLPEFFRGVPDKGESVPVTSDAVPVKWDGVPDAVQENGTSVPETVPVMDVPIETPVQNVPPNVSVERDDEGESVPVTDNVLVDQVEPQSGTTKQKAVRKKAKKTTPPTDINEKRKKAYDKAVQIWKETRKRPGRDKIMKEASCGSSVAKSVIEMLKDNQEEIEKEIAAERTEKEKAENVI
ncbi:hypothetical protein [Desmospora activa]|uniref:DUF2637 domain-containing protein n=1 Tax=Desmospora activa DSM 45169 TaxID=1121389 RepID=A0A2T4YZQ4_9BACL|nr:hypothetical protein [Desmospora activa]PTM52708.1 hypothetical protein C8J48_3701 [Desmospora activa DSM 45169]